MAIGKGIFFCAFFRPFFFGFACNPLSQLVSEMLSPQRFPWSAPQHHVMKEEKSKITVKLGKRNDYIVRYDNAAFMWQSPWLPCKTPLLRISEQSSVYTMWVGTQTNTSLFHRVMYDVGEQVLNDALKLAEAENDTKQFRTRNCVFNVSAMGDLCLSLRAYFTSDENGDVTISTTDESGDLVVVPYDKSALCGDYDAENMNLEVRFLCETNRVYETESAMLHSEASTTLHFEPVLRQIQYRWVQKPMTEEEEEEQKPTTRWTRFA